MPHSRRLGHSLWDRLLASALSWRVRLVPGPVELRSRKQPLRRDCPGQPILPASIPADPCFPTVQPQFIVLPVRARVSDTRRPNPFSWTAENRFRLQLARPWADLQLIDPTA